VLASHKAREIITVDSDKITMVTREVSVKTIIVLVISRLSFARTL
jgi:hypothetical protein